MNGTTVWLVAQALIGATCTVALAVSSEWGWATFAAAATAFCCWAARRSVKSDDA